MPSHAICQLMSRASTVRSPSESDEKRRMSAESDCCKFSRKNKNKTTPAAHRPRSTRENFVTRSLEKENSASFFSPFFRARRTRNKTLPAANPVKAPRVPVKRSAKKFIKRTAVMLTLFRFIFRSRITITSAIKIWIKRYDARKAAFPNVDSMRPTPKKIFCQMP